METKKVVIGCSGGVDSSTGVYFLHSLGFEIIPVYFAGYSRADSAQRKAAEKCCKDLGVLLEVVDFSFYSNLPIRNVSENEMYNSSNALFFFYSALCLIANRIDAGYVSLGLTVVDAKKFPYILSSLEKMSAAISLSMSEHVSTKSSRIEPIFPFSKYEKSQLLIKAQHLGVQLRHTYSCAYEGPIHCGECACCKERKTAFAKSDVSDKTLYIN